jgi:hypothetical protein
MNNIAKSRRASRRRGCRRNRQRGGAGEAYTLGNHVAGAPIINNYGQEIVRFPSCEDATRPGYLENAQIKGGLPGFAGGGKRRKSRKTKKSKKSRRSRSMKGGRGGVLETGAAQLAAQYGGRYTNEFDIVGPSKIALMEPSYSGCGTGMEAISNSLNKGSLSSLITAPPPLVAPPTPGSGDQLQAGGKRVGGVDSMFYSAPRSGYTTWPSNAAGGDAGTLADGKTPFLINVPFSAQPTPSLACLKTGGARKSKKSRKARKVAKKSRKSRKSYKKRN